MNPEQPRRLLRFKLAFAEPAISAVEESGILSKETFEDIVAQRVPSVNFSVVYQNLDFVQKKFAETKSANATAHALAEFLAAGKKNDDYFDF